MIIGARGSDLAQFQAKWVAELLQNQGIDSKIEIINTVGDRILDRPLNELGVQGVFTKEIEEALLDKRIDLAVHSYKDMATLQPDGLGLAAISQREDPADLLIVRREYRADNSPIPLSDGAIVGSSAVRRAAQLLALHPGLEIRDLRGNVPTRLKKLRKGEYHAIMLAAAGVKRLSLDLYDLHVIRFDPVKFIPSPAQGALAVQMRLDDASFESVKNAIHHKMTAQAVEVERSLITEFGGGCSLPLGAYARFEDDRWMVDAFWGGNKDNPLWIHHEAERFTELASLVKRSVFGN